MKIPDWLPVSQRPSRSDNGAPRRLIDHVIAPLAHFLHVEAAGGIVLFACTVLAMVIAHSSWADAFANFWETRAGVTIGGFSLVKPLLLWVNDGLMTIFFFVVGLEIKREVVFGELRDPRKAALPAAAAIGGMIVPALIYYALQRGQPGEAGWGIPMATDIAFVVGFLALLGRRIPFSLKILLLTLAIVDDIGAVIVIAVFYTADPTPILLVPAVIGFGVILLCRQLGVRSTAVYVILGAGIWLAFLKSGVHPTVAGVLLGLLTPARSWFTEESVALVAEGVGQVLRYDGSASDRIRRQSEAARLLMLTAHETRAPLERLETAFHPWVAFFIMPVFALANAGVRVDLNALGHPVALAVAVGLVVGKPVGIFAVSWLAVRLGLARLPTGVNWKILFAAGCLAGVGFTMSLFIAGLALDEDLLSVGKVGILAGSIVSAALGCALLLMFSKGQRDVDGKL